RIGFAPPDLRERSSAVFLTDQIPTQHINHVIDKNLALSAAAVALLGDGSTGNACELSVSNVGTEKEAMSYESRAAAHYSFPLTVPREDEHYVESLVGKSDRRFAIINPGGGWPTKLWQAIRYGQIADWLRTEHQLDSLVTYGPGEEPLAGQVAAGSRLGAARPAPSSLLQFVALARRAAVFVGGGPGGASRATACRTPNLGADCGGAPLRH